MGPSIWQLLIIFAIVLLLFGAKRLRNVGGDLGAAIKSFRGAMKDGEENKNEDAKPVERIEENSQATQSAKSESESATKDNKSA